MQERQVTIEGDTRPLPTPFLVLATQNPIDYEGTYPLPEAQLDRFILRVGVGYPSRDEEWEVLRRRLERQEEEPALTQIVDPEAVRAMQRAIEEVYVAESIGYYIVDLIGATRRNARIQVGASPRGSLALLKLARGKAALAGRDFVTPDDVKAVAIAALGHRLILSPEVWVQRIRSEDIVLECLEQTPTPPADARAYARP